MKNLNVCVLFLFCSFSLVAQNQVNVNASPTKECVPTKACAEKMGMTLEECKKVCTGKTTAVNSKSDANANLAVLASTKEKTCCSSIEECAKKMGMTVEECKAKCASAKSLLKTKVASASLESDVSSETTASSVKKICNKSAKAACSKKMN